MDHAIELKSDHRQVGRASRTCTDTSHHLPSVLLLEGMPLVKNTSLLSIQSLPNRVEPASPCESEIYFLPLREVSASRTARAGRRCNSSDGLREKLLGDENDLDSTSHTANTFDVDHTTTGMRRRRGAARSASSRRLAPADARRREHQARPRSRWLIPAEHSFKVLWDIVTVLLSVANAYATHISIRERKIGASSFMTFCDIWFFVDILLNFVTERKTAEGEILRDYRSICARYLVSWFAVDALSLFRWETLYVKPLFDIQNSRGFFRKTFFRSKAVVRVTRHLRGKHFRWFGKVAKHTKQHGVGAKRLLRLVIKYVPKYLLFFRNMKGVVAVRVLRQVHWVRRFYTNMFVSEEKGDGMTGSLTRDDYEEDDLSSNMSLGDSRRVQVVYENWEFVDDDVPL